MPLLGRCASCDYAIFATRQDVKEASSLDEVKANTGAYRVNGGVVARCDKGHRVFPLRAIKGTYSPDHQCDARCLNAKGHTCTCSCGGANHGRGHAVAVVSVTEEPKHLGEVGKNITGEVTVTERRELPNSVLFTFRAVNTNAILKWFAPSYAAPEWDQGNRLTIRGKVKKHEDHERFGKSTVITYVEEV